MKVEHSNPDRKKVGKIPSREIILLWPSELGGWSRLTWSPMAQAGPRGASIHQLILAANVRAGSLTAVREPRANRRERLFPVICSSVIDRGTPSDVPSTSTTSNPVSVIRAAPKGGSRSPRSQATALIRSEQIV